MDDMREIVTVDQVERLFVLLAVLGPVVGAASGWFVGRRSGRRPALARTGALIGLIGPANWGFWRLYNSITDHLGLDTVRNLLVNLALFIGVGVALGIVLGLAARARGAGGGK